MDEVGCLPDAVTAAGITAWLSQDEAFAQVLRILGRRPHVWIVGGAVRDYALGMQRPQDLDMVAEDAAFGVTVRLLRRHYASRPNRHGNPRFSLPGGSHLDLWSPRRFYKGFTSVEEMLAYFDLSVNAVGVNVSGGAVVDPTGGLDDLSRNRATLHAERWSEASTDEAAILCLRLARLLQRRSLAISNPAVCLLRFAALHSVSADVVARYGHGSSAEVARSLSRRLGRPVPAVGG